MFNTLILNNWTFKNAICGDKLFLYRQLRRNCSAQGFEKYCKLIFSKKILLKRLNQNARNVTFTCDILVAACIDLGGKQKRIDLENNEWAEDKLKWAEIRKRRIRAT